MGQEQLVEQLDFSKPAVSRTPDSLERKGYITRERYPHDRRAHRIRHTDRAREIGPTVERANNRVYGLAMLGISEEDLDRFLRLLGRMSRNLARR